MKRNFILALVLACLLSMSVSAQDTTKALSADLGGYYDADAEAYGVAIEGRVKTAGGLLQLSSFGSFGEAPSALGITPGIFLLEGGVFELAILQGIVTSWDDGTNYNAGLSGLYATGTLPWAWPGYEKPITLFAKWYRQYPLDKEGAQEATGTFTIGVSL